MSIIKHVTLQKIVAHDFRYVPRTSRSDSVVVEFGFKIGFPINTHVVGRMYIQFQLGQNLS